MINTTTKVMGGQKLCSYREGYAIDVIIICWHKL